ncbi:MAG: acyltransferase [Pseudobutyrivibrio sp.]|nr:acyltransferase [Pseudobutyrivibrio sp.]
MKVFGDVTLALASEGRHNNLNLIRLIAALMVFYMHSLILCNGVAVEDIFGKINMGKEYAGGTAVYIFFVISGFLICRSYERSATVKKYFKARFLRIWPLLAVVVTLITFVVGPLYTYFPLSYYFTCKYTWKFFISIFFICTWNYLPGVFADKIIPSVNGSIWTIMYEVICYILVAVTGFIWKRHRIAAPVFTAILGCIHIAWKILEYPSIGPISGDFISNFAKLGMLFCVGMTYYLYREKIKLSWWLVLISVVGLEIGILFFDFPLFFALFGSYLVMFFSFSKTWKISQAYEKVGDLSYCIYLSSFTIQQIVCSIFNNEMNAYLNMIISLVICIPLAYISYRYFEAPLMKLKNK